MQVLRPEILDFIKFFIQDHNEEALVETFTMGDCYHFSVILKDIYPEGEIYYDSIVGHFFFKLDGKCYDITGRITVIDDNVQSFEDIKKKDPAYYNRLLRDCIYKLHWLPGVDHKYVKEDTDAKDLFSDGKPKTPRKKTTRKEPSKKKDAGLHFK